MIEPCIQCGKPFDDRHDCILSPFDPTDRLAMFMASDISMDEIFKLAYNSLFQTVAEIPECH